MSRVALTFLLLAACTPARKAEPVGSIYVLTADVVATDGATLEINEGVLAGVRLGIPPDALARNTRVTVTIASDVPRDDSTPTGPAVEIGPPGTILRLAARLTLPLTTVPSPARTRVYARDNSGPRTTRMPDVLDVDPAARELSFDTYELLTFQPAAATDSCAGRSCPEGLVCRNGGCFAPCGSPQPLRHILFVVSQSSTLAESDPANTRLDAILDVIESFVADPETSELEPGARFAVVGFHGDAVVATQSSPGVPGFSGDGIAIQSAVAGLATLADASVAYDRALTAVDELVDASMAALDAEERLRASYQVVFVTDGPPTPNECDTDNNAPGRAVRRVELLREKAAFFNVGLEVNTAFIADPTRYALPYDPASLCCMRVDRPPFSLVPFADCDSTPITTGQLTRSLLGEMARAGGGSFLTFSDTTPADFGAIDFRPVVHSPCPGGYVCRPSTSLCLPNAPPGDTCLTDNQCPFGSLCLAGVCVADQYGCGNDCTPSSANSLKVLFAVDTAGALARPEGDVQRAIVTAMQSMSAKYAYAAYRIVGFDSESWTDPHNTAGCPVFSRNWPALTLFLNDLEAGNATDLHGLLNIVHADLLRDMQGILGQSGCRTTREHEELAGTHYVVVVVAANPPSPVCSLGLGNDFDPENPTQSLALCEDTDLINCTLKRELGRPGGTECDEPTYGTCGETAACGYGAASCCDTDAGWDGIGAPPHARLFGGLAGESELRGGDAYNQAVQLDARTRAIIALREQFSVASIRLHTVWVPPEDLEPTAEREARELLRRVADTGRGLALAFAGEEVDLAPLGLDSPHGHCPEKAPAVTCGAPPPTCDDASYPAHSSQSLGECGLSATWTGECLPCD